MSWRPFFVLQNLFIFEKLLQNENKGNFSNFSCLYVNKYNGL